MTPLRIKMVQDSFRQVVPMSAQAAAMFYDRLFEIAPEVRPLFPTDLAEQKKKLMTMLAIAVHNLHHVDTISAAVQALAKRHVGYGVTAAHYEPVGHALIWTLGKGLGGDFTPELKEAWIATFAMISAVMTTAAAEVTT